MGSGILDWVALVGSLVLSWPVVAVLVVCLLRRQLVQLLEQFSRADLRRAKIGPVEIERELSQLAERGGEAVDRLDRLSELMAESRLLELEITQGGFGSAFTAEQRERMQAHIDELRELTKREKGESRDDAGP